MGTTDPRTDRHPEDGATSHEPPTNSKPQPAEGGVGTGTKTDPAKAPDAGPKQ